MIYLLIFIAKLVENSIATIRLIMLSNGKKLLGAFLNFIMSIIWIISTGLVIVDYKDYFKILAFSLGCFLGSLIGSNIERKIALGNNMLYIITNDINKIKNELDKYNYQNYILNEQIIILNITRKKRNSVINIIKSIDNKAVILSIRTN